MDGGIKVRIFDPAIVTALLIQAQVEASMCHLRGLVMLKLNRSDQAKKCFLEALALDVKCYDSFEQLINGEMMSADEGDQLLPTSGPSLMRIQSGISSRASRIRIRHLKMRTSFA